MSQESVPSVGELSQSVKDLTSAVSAIQRQQERLLDSFLVSQTGLQAQSSTSEKQGMFCERQCD